MKFQVVTYDYELCYSVYVTFIAININNDVWCLMFQGPQAGLSEVIQV